LKEVDAGKIIKYAVSLLNGKGGGPPEMAHGGIPLNDRDVINEVIQKSLDSI
jgi:alanyl-tRNA synthetase